MTTSGGTNSRYGSENFAREFRDLQATTMSVDRNSEHALLAGRKYLAVISLDMAKDKLLYRLTYGGKYEISITQWSKMENSSNSVAIASSQRCDIFELADGAELKCLHRLKGHTRVITDLDWCPLQANLLATCSFDSFVHVWDIRTSRTPNNEKPQLSLSALDGASQVKWNKLEQDVLASCDGGHIKVWDIRKPNAPTEYIAAHASKINGLEWASKDTIITAAQDCTVKFSTLSGQSQSKNNRGPVLSTTAPVWRARPAPFGRGIVTQCVPILRRDSGLLSLWDWRRFSSPVYTFQAHDIVEFAWKKDESFELLTWSRDQTLRMWTLPYEIVELCGGGDGSRPQGLLNATSDESALEGGLEMLGDDEDSLSGSPKPERPLTAMSRHAFTRKDRSSSERRSRKSSSPTPMTKRDEVLMNEFEKVETEKPDTITFDQVELERGLLRFSWVGKADSKGRTSGITAGILVSFPLGYPAASPTFLVTNSSTEVDKNHIIKSLRNVAQQNAKKNDTCLLPCLNIFVSIMQSIKVLDADNSTDFPTIGVSNVPFPRTSGARFCSVGMLVCFGRPTYLRRIKSNTDSGTPRSLSALGPFLSQLAHEEDGRSRRTRRLEKKKANIVTVFDVTPMLPFSRGLGENYNHIVGNPRYRKQACSQNVVTARNGKKLGVANTWQAASIVAKYANSRHRNPRHHSEQQFQAVHVMQMPEDDDDESNWITYHPLGSDLIHTMITHYAKHGDVQTAGTMACLFTTVDSTGFPTGIANGEPGHSSKSVKSQNKQLLPPGAAVSPYHTVHASDTHHGTAGTPTITDSYFIRQHRSNSWSDSLDDMRNLTMYDGTLIGSNGGGMNGSHHRHNNGMNSSGIGSSVINGTISGSSSNIMGNTGGRMTVSSQMMSSTTNGFKDLDMALGLSMDGSCSSNSNGGNNEKPLLPIPRGYILNPGLNSLYDCYKKSYAEILYRWGLLQQRAEVLKTLTLITENHMIIRAGVDFSIDCRNCRQIVKGPFCQHCKRIASICAICHRPARGLSTFCTSCGHGGHSIHMLNWFKTKKMCAAGCGCFCIEENTKIFKS